MFAQHSVRKTHFCYARSLRWSTHIKTAIISYPVEYWDFRGFWQEVGNSRQEERKGTYGIKFLPQDLGRTTISSTGKWHFVAYFTAVFMSVDHSRDVLLTQSSANATRHVCAAFRQENAFLLCNVSTRFWLWRCSSSIWKALQFFLEANFSF